MVCMVSDNTDRDLCCSHNKVFCFEEARFAISHVGRLSCNGYVHTYYIMPLCGDFYLFFFYSIS